MSEFSTETLARKGESLFLSLESASQGGDQRRLPLFSPDFHDLGAEPEERDDTDLRRSESVLAEVEQGLRDLGFLSIQKSAEGYSLKVLEEALISYYQELRRFEDSFSYHVAEAESGPPINAVRDQMLRQRLSDPLVITFESLARLRALTSLDGQLSVTVLPKAGEVSLVSRHLFHHLKVFGFVSKRSSAGRSWGKKGVSGLRAMRSIRDFSASETTLLQVAQAIADMDTLVQQFVGLLEGVSFIIPAPRVTKTGRELWGKSIKRQKETFRDVKIPRSQINWSSRPKKTKSKHLATHWNLLGMRFLQITLWHFGYYHGEIDGLWGKMSQEAFDQALREFDFPPKKVRAKNSHGHGTHVRRIRREFVGNVPSLFHRYYRYDVSGFLKSCVAPLIKEETEEFSPDDVFAIHDEIDESLNETPLKDDFTERALSPEEKKEKVWNGLFHRMNEIDDLQSSRQRRKNYGLGIIGAGIKRIKTWFTSLVQKVKSLFMRVADFVRDVVVRISGVSLQVFRYLKRIFLKGIELAKLAGRRTLRFFTGQPYITGGGKSDFLVTRFSLDQDALNLSGESLSKSVIERHFDQISAENRALGKVLRIGYRVIELVSKLSLPLGLWSWASFAWDVVRGTWKLFQKWQEDWKKVVASESAPWRTGMLLTT